MMREKKMMMMMMTMTKTNKETAKHRSQYRGDLQGRGSEIGALRPLLPAGSNPKRRGGDGKGEGQSQTATKLSGGANRLQLDSDGVWT